MSEPIKASVPSTRGRVVASLMAVLSLLPWRCVAEEPQGLTPDATSGVGVQVFYATDRKRREGAPVDERYGGERGEPHFGRCGVRFLPIPFMDDVVDKVPFYLPRETGEVRVAQRLNPEDFWLQLATAAGKTETASVVVFVHGYNYGFARNCRMAAALQRNLAGKATVLMFSWPANMGPAEYVRDQADLEWSVPFLAELLAQLGERAGPRRIQLLAHSLGSRGSLYALQRLGTDVSARPLIERLVLLAPDFDAQTFVELLPRLRPLVGGINLYASNKDAPLKLSRQLSGYPRLGEGGELLTVAEGMETIDVSASGRYEILGHEYYYYHPLVKADLTRLLTTGEGAERRPGLRARISNGQHFWEIHGLTGN